MYRTRKKGSLENDAIYTLGKELLLMKPITRKEFYLAKAAGTYTGPTPPPVLREDYYLATLSGDYSGNCPAPVTRLEKYMSAAAGLTTYVPQPVTRVEMYWYAIAKGTGYAPEPVTREEHFLYEIITAGPKYIDKIAEGSLILLTDSAEAPLTALTVYGHSTQSGTPSRLARASWIEILGEC